MRSTRLPLLRRSALLGIALLLGACAAHQPPPPDYPPLASVERAGSDAASPVDVSLLRVEYRFDASGRYTRTLHDRYEILTEKAIDGWGAAEARWSPWHLERPEIHATVTSREGVESKLEPSALSEAAAYPEAPDLYGDERVLRGPLPHVAVGSVVDEVVVLRSRIPFVGSGEVFEMAFQTNVPRKQVELVVDLPEGMPFKFDVRDAKVTTEDAVKDGRRIVTFRGGPYAPLEPVEAFAPSDVADWPSVAFTTAPSWKPIVAEYARIVDSKLADARLEGVVAKVVQKDDAPLVKAEKLLAWVRDRVRYVGIEFGDSSVVPRTPDETLKHGYGDCKDQAVLLVGLLRAANVPAEVALLRAGYGEDVHPTLAGLNVFNHAIVRIAGSAPIWIDPTSPRARAGDLPTPDQGRWALRIAPGSESLSKTPHADQTANTHREVRQIFLPDYGRSRVVETATYSGALERSQREGFVGDAQALAKWHKSYVAKTYSSDAPGRLEVTDVKDLSKPFSVVVEAKESRDATTGLADATTYIDPMPVFSWVPSSLLKGDDRRADFAVPSPYTATLVYEVHPPAGFAIDQKPAAADLTFGPAKLRRTVEVRPDGVALVTLSFVMPKERWSPAEVTAFRKAYAALREENFAQLSFVHAGQREHRARAYDKELSIYRAEIGKQPDATLPKLRMALALASLGFGARARQLADEVAKANPSDPDVWDNIGYLRSFDAAGRIHHAGWDRQAAIAAFREARKRDASDLYATVSLASSLELDDAGEHYAPGSQLDEAVATLDEVPADKLAAYEHGKWINNALFDLLWAGKYDAVRERAKKIDPAKVAETAVIAAAALQGGANAGLAEAMRLAMPEGRKAASLVGAADILVEMRKYPEAAALLGAAAGGSSDAGLKARVAAIGKTKAIDFRTLPVTTPEAVVTKVLALCSSRPASWKDDLGDALSPRLGDEKGNVKPEALCAELGESSRGSERVRRATADVLATMIEPHAVGSDDTGFRVQVKLPGLSAYAYVVREGKRYQVRGFEARPSDLGCEAFTQWKAGRKAAATQWLTWAREGFHAAAGDDPLRDAPFMQLWKDKADDVELGAAALCAQGGHADLVAKALEAARGRASAERAPLLTHALANAYWDGAHDAELLAEATTLRRAYPKSKVAWTMTRFALAKLGRFQELRDLAADRLAKEPNGDEELEALAAAEDLLGHPKEARAVGERWISTGKGGARAYNAQAWRSLYGGGPVGEKELGYALQAVTLEPSSWGNMNTLAAVDAEVGHVADAVDHFRKSLEMRGDPELEEADWYVVGRIAELLGMPDEAKRAYAKIQPPKKQFGAYTLHHLAAARLRALK
jgi:transglutaminase-like putative cysteine protease/tetratricopeptide (TPR) repeat protein